jgi:hypothetical protein
MSLSRKHFQDLADIIKETKRQFALHPEERPDILLKELEDNIAFFCRKHNPSFDVARFEEACTYEPVKEKNYVSFGTRNTNAGI